MNLEPNQSSVGPGWSASSIALTEALWGLLERDFVALRALSRVHISQGEEARGKRDFATLPPEVSNAVDKLRCLVWAIHIQSSRWRLTESKNGATVPEYRAAYRQN